MLVVEQAIVAIDIEQIATILVAMLAVGIELELDRAASEEQLAFNRRFRPIALDRLPRIDRLRSIDAEHAHGYLAAIHARLECIAVHDIGDLIISRGIDRNFPAGPSLDDAGLEDAKTHNNDQTRAADSDGPFFIFHSMQVRQIACGYP